MSTASVLRFKFKLPRNNIIDKINKGAARRERERWLVVILWLGRISLAPKKEVIDRVPWPPKISSHP